MSGMNISENAAEEGRINVRIKGEEIDIASRRSPPYMAKASLCVLLTRGKIFFQPG